MKKEKVAQKGMDHKSGLINPNPKLKENSNIEHNQYLYPMTMKA